MKKPTYYLAILWIVFYSPISTSQVGIGTVNPTSESILDIESIDKGILHKASQKPCKTDQLKNIIKNR